MAINENLKEKLLQISSIIPDGLYIQLKYYTQFKKIANLKNPITFNEKLQWLKLNDRNPMYTNLVDKYKVKEYVADTIGEHYVIPTLGTYDSPDDIDFGTLPQQFVLKWNHDSGSVIVCRDKNNFEFEQAIEKLRGREKHNGYLYGREWPYKNVQPKIIAEQYMEDGCTNGQGLRDYKFYCFEGKPQYLYVSEGLENHETASISFLTLDWEFAPFGRSDFKPFIKLPKKPTAFDEMLAIAEKLSDGYHFLRVDLYEIDGRVYFSELTFYPCSGLMPFDKPEWDNKLGDLIKLPTDK